MRIRFTIPFYSLLLILFSVYSLSAQGTLKGTVTDDSGEPVIGATVSIEGTQTGAITDVMGAYVINNIDAGDAVIIIQYVGFDDQRRTVLIENGVTRTLDIQISESTEILDEIVVVGYGVQRRREIVGSVAKVDSKELTDVVGGSFENVLQGKIAGAQITQSSGIAGAGSLIRIRGVGSISSGGEPLFVVDGIPITQENFLTGSSNGQNNNPLSSLNPNDIQSVEVLKDASASAIYGSRGSNGVIIITTKRGNNSKPIFDFSTRIGFSEPTRIVEVLNADEWLQVNQESWENDGNVGRAPLPTVLTENGLGYEDIANIDTRWYDHVIRTGLKQEYNLSMKQGLKNFNSYVGLSYSDAESYLVGNSYERVSLRSNLDYKIKQLATISFSGSVTRGTNDRIAQAWAGGLGTAQTSALPIYPIYGSDGSYFNLYGNPVAERELTSNKTREWRSINNLIVSVTPHKDLTLNFSGNYDYMNIDNSFYEEEQWTNFDNLAKRSRSNVNNWSTFGTATYDIPIQSEEHRLQAFAGMEYQQSSANGFYMEVRGVDDHLFANPNKLETFDTIQPPQDFEFDKWKFFGVFTRVNYSYKDKLMAQFVFRRDGSSKFGQNKRFGNFPSLGIGYILSEEKFLYDNPVISFLKLKASWGITGNSDIDWQEQYPIRVEGDEASAGEYYNGETIRYEAKLENPNLQWEVNTSYDAGIELGLWQDRMTFNFTFYNKLTSKAIVTNRLQGSLGINDLEFNENVAKIRNRGFEVELTSHNIKGKFRWKTDFNIAFNKNIVLEVANATPDALNGGFGDTRVVEGYPVGVNFIVPFSHVDPTTGRPVYLDQDGNETFVYDVVNGRQPVENIFPDYVGGITNTFNYKNFDLSFLFTYQIGGTIYDDAAKRQLGVVTDWNMRREVFDRWRQPGDVARFPQLTQTMLNWGGNANFWQNNHSLWLYDASFVRLKNLTFGYNHDFKNQKNPVKSMRVFFNATNLLTFTEFDGWDPEISRDRNSPQERNVGGTGVTYLTAPQERTFNFGINLSFQ